MKEDGALEPDELACVESLAAAWNAFAKLTPTHPSDAAEMCAAIHRAQDIIACRLARRVAPDVFLSRVRKE